MLTNDQMKPGRFLALYHARKAYAFIRAHLEAGRSIALCTATRATIYRPRHLDHFAIRGTLLHVRRGRGWDGLLHGSFALQVYA